MNRRDAVLALIALGALPLSIEAQQRGRVYRIGVLLTDPRNQSFELFRRNLRELGWIEGQNLTLEVRYSEGRAERLPELAAQFARLNVDLIVVEAAPHTEAARQATKSIPIVFLFHGDPVGSGHVASLARPGGNITGVRQMLPELSAKRLQLLKELLPGATRVAVFWNAANPTKHIEWKATQDAGQALMLTLDSREVTSSDDFPVIFGAIRRAKPDAVLVLEDPLTYFHRPEIVEFAARERLPAIYGVQGLENDGSFMTYGIDPAESYRLGAVYVDKILKGAKPADLPVQQPTRFELMINLKTAKALRVKIPQSVLLRADRIIE